LQLSAGKLVHISGAHAAGDLVGALAAIGFNTERRIAYQARAASTLPETLKDPLDLVLFHSARAAENFIALAAPGAEHLIAACLSPAVAEAASATRWVRVVVALRPREDALLDAAFGDDAASA
jgi:uroporphyrinogen-III synthase